MNAYKLNLSAKYAVSSNWPTRKSAKPVKIATQQVMIQEAN